MKPGGKDGKLYDITRENAITGGSNVSLTTSGFYYIKSVASSSSSLPSPDSSKDGYRKLKAGDVVYLYAGQTLATGDAVIPFTLSLIGFVTDVSNSRSGNKTDITTQENLDSGVREFTVSPFSEGSGTINGMVETDSEQQRNLLNQFAKIAEVTENNGTATVTILPAKQRKQEYMLSRRETDVAGETAMWEYFPITVDSLNMDKPMDGAQNFNFNYTLDGGRNPCVIYYKVKASS
jgi:hypothetical protein